MADGPAVLSIVVVGGRDPARLAHAIATLPAAPGFCVLALAPGLEAAALTAAGARLPVVPLDGATRLDPDRVVVVPTDRAVVLDGETLASAAGGPPPVAPLDALLRVVADAHGPASAAILLAQPPDAPFADGVFGIKRLKEAGGLTLAEATDGAGDGANGPADPTGGTAFVDLVLPLDELVPRVVEFARHPRAPLLPLVDPSEAADEELRLRPATDAVAATLRDILTLVRVRSGHDFSTYKRATLFRRVARRVQVCNCDTLATYLQLLRDRADELSHLVRDFLISVTSFFRDRDTFDTLAVEVIPRLFHGKGPSDQVRVWVAGCATGEEAYSIGILLLEYASKLEHPPKLQIFATDIDEVALAEARAGSYGETIAGDVSATRLDRYFTREPGRYRVCKELRDLVLFSPHNVLRDPPFSRLDLVSCRNLLIYLDREGQNRVLAVFHFGLRHDGLLLLGSSESAESSPLFGPRDPKHRVFVRRLAPSSLGDAITHANPQATLGRWQTASLARTPAVADRGTPLGELHLRLLEAYAPPSVLVDNDLEILHLSPSAGHYLALAGGEPTRQLLRLLPTTLGLDVRTTIYAARQHGAATRRSRTEAGHPVEIRVRAVEAAEAGGKAMLVMFDERPDEPPDHGPGPSTTGPSTIEPVVREMEDELQHTRGQLRITVEQYETSLEELKASNEELQAINEELRAATEELETSKEELQSVNEELTTLNVELKLKVDEVSHANADLQNLMTSTEIGVVFLDRALNIKRFTARAQALFNIIPSDIGRPLAHLTHRLEADDLAAVAQTVLQTLRTVEREIHSKDGRLYLARWLPYRSLEDRIDGIVITFVDMTELRAAVSARARSETQLRLSEERMQIALRVAPIAIASFDATARTTWAYGLGHGDTTDDGELLAELAAPDRPRLLDAVRRAIALRAGQRVETELVTQDDAPPRSYDFRVEPIESGAIAVGFDITPSKAAERSLREADRRKDEFLATVSHELRNPLAPLKVALEVARLVDDPAERANALDVMERQVGMLSHLVDELLDLSRITQGKIALRLAPVDLADVVRDAVETTRAPLAAHHLALDIPGEPIEIVGDRLRLVQIVTNLLSNAAKYTPAGGHVRVEVARDRPAGRAIVRVGDDGIGIAADDLANLFEIFFQCRDAAGRAKGGLGIGLNLVRKLVELHGGTVRAASDGAGQGTTFTIELPIGGPGT